MADPKWSRSYLEAYRQTYPELFPASFAQGYKCVGFCEPSKKMPEVKVRRVRSKAVDEAGKTETYQVVPCFVLPYLTGYAAEVEKALFLHFKYEVPFDGVRLRLRPACPERSEGKGST